MAPASAVPLSVTAFALVTPSPTGPVSGVYLATIGVLGATVSTVTVRTADGALALPASSVTVVVKLWAPSEKLFAATLQAPLRIGGRSADLPRTVEDLDHGTGFRCAAQRHLFALVTLPTASPPSRATAATGEAQGPAITLTARTADGALVLPATSCHRGRKIMRPVAKIARRGAPGAGLVGCGGATSTPPS